MAQAEWGRLRMMTRMTHDRRVSAGVKEATTRL